MIPASYLFKNYYAREWLEDRPEPAAPTAAGPDRDRGGGLTRLIAATVAAARFRWSGAAAAGHRF